jgi:hypothetical protein
MSDKKDRKIPSRVDLSSHFPSSWGYVSQDIPERVLRLQAESGRDTEGYDRDDEIESGSLFDSPEGRTPRKKPRTRKPSSRF